MPLVTGARLGPYEIISPIGAGGMGEVYRARDTKLRRDVAIKILPETFALGPDRLARFEREAQVLAALNHQHIAQIYGVEESNGIRALVMELVEGPTLDERIGGQPMPGGEALAIARQIAEALEAAHEAGIIHRDLKPSNIKVRDDGTVKVLDFGLAKADGSGGSGRSGGSADALTHSQTITSPAATTGTGVILGTAAYMAPEQTKGRAVDKRADIWAFGCVLYEMLTGQRAFSGDDVSDTLAAVLRSDPDWTLLPVATPRRIVDLLQQCLTKDPRQRLRDIGDARLELDLASDPTHSAPTAPGTSRAKSAGLAWTLASVSALGFVALATAVVAGVWLRVRPPAQLVVRFHISPPAGVRIPSRANIASISPDARNVAFVGEADRGTALWIRPIDGRDADAWRVPGSNGAVVAPFWRPDGGTIAFAVPGLLRAVDIRSREPRLVCPLPVTTDPIIEGAWSPGDDIVFVVGPELNVGGQLFEVPAQGGTPHALTRELPGHTDESWMYPQFLGNGRLFSMIWVPDRDRLELAVSPVENPARTARSVSPVFGPAVVASGHLIYGRENVLVAQSFDEAAVRTGSDVSIITPGVQYEHVFGWLVPAFSVSQNGALLYREGSLERREFSIVDRRGSVVGRVGEPAEYVTFAVSADGRSIVAGRSEPDKLGIWKIDTASGNLSLISSSKEATADPTLGRPGFITFGENFFERKIWEIPIEGGSRTRLAAGDVLHDRTHDGAWLLVGELNSLRARAVADPQRSIELVNDGRGVDEARFSPDGRSVAYNSTESGEFEVYVARMPPTGKKLKVSMGGGVQPQWRADGRELYYLALDGTLMALDINCPPDAACTAGVPHALFATGVASPHSSVEDYGVFEDGQRFVILNDSSEPGPLTVVLNWPELLKR